ncbi:MAG: hypothetical protein AAF921_06615 [Cyanobacteria bacterium P01_D01_bin.44]
MRQRTQWLLLMMSVTIVVASFLPWAVKSPQDLLNPFETPQGGLFSQLQSKVAFAVFNDLTSTFTAWRGQFTIAGYGLPSWVVVLGALAIPLCVNRPTLGLCIAFGSLLHLIAFGLALTLFKATLSIGYFMTLAAYLITIGSLIIRWLFRRRTAS